MPHLLDGDGPIVGTIGATASKWLGLEALFHRKPDARTAATTFIRSFEKHRPPHVVRLTSAVHAAVLAPTGAGKGVGIALPHLLTCRDSTVVLDFKGELYRETAAARREMGQRVACIDPFGPVAGTDPLNPLSGIDPNSGTAADGCRGIAAAVVVRTGTGQDPYWNNAAEAEIAFAVGAVVRFAEPPDRNLQSVRKVLSDPALRAAMIDACRASGLGHGILARWANQSAQLRDKQLDSVLATANSRTRLLDTVSVLKNTRAGNFDPADPLDGTTTVYLVLPPEHVKSQAGLLRLWVGALLRTVMEGGLDAHRKVQFLLDEASSLGPMDALQQALDVGRGYGVRLIFLYQNVSRLRACWPEGGDRNLPANTSRVVFAVNDLPTAEYVSNRLGEATITVGTGGTSRNTSSNPSKAGTTYSHSYSTSSNWRETARKLLQPSEVLSADERVAFCFTPGVRPIRTRLCRSYERDYLPRRTIGTVRGSSRPWPFFSPSGPSRSR